MQMESRSREGGFPELPARGCLGAVFLELVASWSCLELSSQNCPSEGIFRLKASPQSCPFIFTQDRTNCNFVQWLTEYNTGLSTRLPLYRTCQSTVTALHPPILTSPRHLTIQKLPRLYYYGLHFCSTPCRTPSHLTLR